MYRLLVLSFLSSLLFSKQLHAEWFNHTFNSMGTRAHVEFWLEDKENNEKSAELLINAVVAEMTRLDKALSPYISTSELSLLNKLGTSKKVKISEEFYSLIEDSIAISKMSNGAFDITYASVGYQYDFRENIRPDSAGIQNTLSAINYKAIALEQSTHEVYFMHEDVKIDLGGIAKGYAINRCIEILKSAGVQHALMNAGGDTALLGDRLGRPWLVGIKHPRSDDKNAVHIPLANEVISTSGDYERYFIEDGVRYHHILNPKTGDSARKVVSVSVIGKDATAVDALSTTVFVQGLQAGMALIDNLEGYEAIIIDNNQRLHFSAGLKQ